MKTSKLFFATMLGLSISAAAHAQNLSYKISGKLQNISPMPAKMYLAEIIPTGILSKPVDSAVVINGQYQFSGYLNADEPFGVVIGTQAKGAKRTDQIQCIVDKGELQITSTNSIDNYTVAGNGAAAQHQFDDMKASTKAALDSIKAIQATDAYKSDKKLQSATMSKSMHMLSQTIFDMYTYIKAHPDNRISPYATFFLTQLPMLSPAGKDTLVSLLPEHAKADKLGQIILKTRLHDKKTADSLAAKRAVDDVSKIAVGSKAIDFTQNDVNGKPVSLSSFKGKYVLVDFWASWCMPCRAENPNVVKAYQQYKDKGFAILGVSLDGQTTKEAWIKAIEKDGLDWTQVSDLAGWKNAVAALYDIRSIPQNFLIGPDGTIIAKDLRGEVLNTKLASIFNK